MYIIQVKILFFWIQVKININMKTLMCRRKRRREKLSNISGFFIYIYRIKYDTYIFYIICIYLWWLILAPNFDECMSEKLIGCWSLIWFYLEAAGEEILTFLVETIWCWRNITHTNLQKSSDILWITPISTCGLKTTCQLSQTEPDTMASTRQGVDGS